MSSRWRALKALARVEVKRCEECFKRSSAGRLQLAASFSVRGDLLALVDYVHL